ncbi:hypothetical protein MRX96_041331 [Rhipicephalus microplus]
MHLHGIASRREDWHQLRATEPRAEQDSFQWRTAKDAKLWLPQKTSGGHVEWIGIRNAALIFLVLPSMRFVERKRRPGEAGRRVNPGMTVEWPRSRTASLRRPTYAIRAQPCPCEPTPAMRLAPSSPRPGGVGGRLLIFRHEPFPRTEPLESSSLELVPSVGASTEQLLRERELSRNDKLREDNAKSVATAQLRFTAVSWWAMLLSRLLSRVCAPEDNAVEPSRQARTISGGPDDPISSRSFGL